MSERTPITAAVLNRPGSLDIEQVFLDGPGPEEVRVRPAYVGLCHSDLHYIDGTHHTDLPEVLGHEAAGVVVAVGTNVTRVSVGDHVVTSLTMFCGHCRYCVTGRMSLCANRASLRQRDRPALVNGDGVPVGVMGGIGGFAEELLIHQNGVVVIDDSVPLAAASLFGCALLTGVGAVTRSVSVPVGATIAVVGCGGIGLAAVQGARLAGASRIIAIDRSPDKLDAARFFGATDTVLSDESTEDAVVELTGGGVDFSFEAVGRQETAELSFGILAPGGTCTVLGMVPDSTPIRVPASALYFSERKLQGAFIGSSRFLVDVPELTALYQQGRLLLDEMITHTVSLDEINTGFGHLASGRALRVVVDMRSAVESDRSHTPTQSEGKGLEVEPVPEKARPF